MLKILFLGEFMTSLIAQKVERIVQEVVCNGPGGYEAVDYTKLVPLLIEAIKTLNTKNEQLQKEMRGLIDTLKKIVESYIKNK